jgi:hypothetical protein
MAGVAVLALSSPVEGEVVFTATHQVFLPDTMFRLDLNKDGVNDFEFVNYLFKSKVSYPGSWGSIFVEGSQFGNEVIATSPSQPAFAQALNSGAEVSSKGVFGTFRNNLLSCGNNPINSFRFRSGPWIEVKNKFVGLKFKIQGATHFGWARFTTEQRKNYCENYAVLTGYAYETVANKPIITGKPSRSADAELPLGTLPSVNHSRMPATATLGLLSLGAPGLTIWRRKDELVGEEPA